VTRRRVLVGVVFMLIPIAAHAVWDQVEASLLARDVARIAQRGEPVSVAFQRFVLPTREQRAAARVYAAAADLAAIKYRDDPKLYKLDDELEAAFASGKPAERLEGLRRQYVEGEPAFGLLAQASTLAFAGFGPAAPELYENAFPLVSLNDLNCLRVDIMTAGGDVPGASGALMQSFHLQRTIPLEHYRYLAARRWYGSLRLLLRHASPDGDTLLRLQRAMEELPDQDSLVEELQVERAKLLGDFWPYPPSGSAWAFRGRMSVRDVNSLAFVLLRPPMTHAFRSQLRPFEEAIDVARRPWPEKWNSLDAVVSRYGDLGFGPRKHRSWLDRAVRIFPFPLGMRALQSSLLVAGLDLAMRRTSIAALAVERFRRAHSEEAPATLAVLVPEYLAAIPLDPFSGQPLGYRRNVEDYVVYSIAQNHADDGGAITGLGSGVPPRKPNEAPGRGGDLGIRVPLTSRQ
jgi:hypothetical protein